MSATVTALALTPVKGLRLLGAERVELRHEGVHEDRRFFLIDARDRMVNGKSHGELQRASARYDAAQRTLTVELPGGELVTGPVQHDGEATVRFYSRTRTARLVSGPWAQALSELAGQPLRLCEAADGATASDRGRRGGISIVSRASLERLAQAGGEPSIDPRRFRMLIEVDGVPAHAEDAWVGRALTIGSATVRIHGHVGRCLITSRDPESGEIDLPTLELLRSYRSDVEATEPLPFGVYGEVVHPGAVGVGDALLEL